MTTQLKTVDESNWRDCVKLIVSEKEKRFVDRNVFAIAEWKFEPENYIKAIYSNDNLVGMLAYYFHDGNYGNFYWLYHLMIEPKYQGKGYGQEAVVILPQFNGLLTHETLSQVGESYDKKKSQSLHA